MKPHKHAALIKAWADGAVLQYFSPLHKVWVDVESNNPSWGLGVEYRIKPEPTDLEKYGKEVGDVWKLDSGEIRTLRTLDKRGWVISLRGTNVHECALVELMFRRGEVNKL